MPGIPERDLPTLLGDCCEVDPGRMRRIKLGEDDVLRLAVDHEAAIAALADARVLRAFGDPVGAREDLALGHDHAAAGVKPGVRLKAGGRGIRHRYRPSWPC